jgi:hypothetical protein
MPQAVTPEALRIGSTRGDRSASLPEEGFAIGPKLVKSTVPTMPHMMMSSHSRCKLGRRLNIGRLQRNPAADRYERTNQPDHT